MAPFAGAVVAEPVRYPHPDLKTLDSSFKGFLGNTPIRRLYTSPEMYWAEGPAWNSAGKYLVWSDIPANVQYRWLAEDGHVSVFRGDSNYSNGNTFDREGRQISFEHLTRRVVRYEVDGSVTVLAESFDGKSLNGPNDGIVHPNGDLWFSDPGYGALGEYEGTDAPGDSPQPFQKEAVYRLDLKTRKLHKVSDEIFKPNGVCFSPDYTRLYVADTGASHYGAAAPPLIKSWDVVDESRLVNGRVFASMAMDLDGKTVAGFADGIRCDRDGNIWSSAGWVGAGYDGVHVFNPEGQRVGQILLPELCANLCFGGVKHNRLFMTASQSLYAVYTGTRGAHFC
ncbi:MAG: SMP-30/gluconolactonase/LRE family protein [Pseudomonadales bacterium]|nr:SMP-30/gluconolactonase/LRE family protein [Pseudomonadales bacterium]